MSQPTPKPLASPTSASKDDGLIALQRQYISNLERALAEARSSIDLLRGELEAEVSGVPMRERQSERKTWAQLPRVLAEEKVLQSDVFSDDLQQRGNVRAVFGQLPEGVFKRIFIEQRTIIVLCGGSTSTLGMATNIFLTSNLIVIFRRESPPLERAAIAHEIAHVFARHVRGPISEEIAEEEAKSLAYAWGFGLAAALAGKGS